MDKLIFLANYLLLKDRGKIFENLQKVDKLSRKTPPENITGNNGIRTALGTQEKVLIALISNQDTVNDIKSEFQNLRSET